MKKIIFIYFLLSLFSYANSEILKCNVDNYYKFRNEGWESGENRIFIVTIDDTSLEIYNQTADQNWGTYFIFNDHQNFINALQDTSEDSSAIDILTYNKTNGYFKYLGTNNYGETLHQGWCLNNLN